MAHLDSGSQAVPILLDALPEGFRIELALRRLPEGDAGRPALVLRLAEHVRLLDPARAASLAAEAEAGGEDPGRCAAVRAAALLEDARHADAVPWIGRVPEGPGRTLLEARRLLLAEGPEAALPILDGLADDPATPPGIRAEALSFRLRARAAAGDEHALEDLDALERLCVEQRATLTGVWVGALKGVLRSRQFAGLARVLGAWEAAMLVAEATKGVSLDAAKLGAVPAWVHGVLVKHRHDPERIAAILVPLAALLWRIGQEDDAYRTVVIGERAVRRVVGDAAAAPLAEFGETLRAKAGEEKWAALEAALIGGIAGPPGD